MNEENIKRKCPHCEHLLSNRYEDARFCPFCGKPLREELLTDSDLEDLELKSKLRVIDLEVQTFREHPQLDPPSIRLAAIERREAESPLLRAAYYSGSSEKRWKQLNDRLDASDSERMERKLAPARKNAELIRRHRTRILQSRPSMHLADAHSMA